MSLWSVYLRRLNCPLRNVIGCPGLRLKASLQWSSSFTGRAGRWIVFCLCLSVVTMRVWKSESLSWTELRRWYELVTTLGNVMVQKQSEGTGMWSSTTLTDLTCYYYKHLYLLLRYLINGSVMKWFNRNGLQKLIPQDAGEPLTTTMAQTSG